ncbi:MAG: Hsp70 family protein, partial [Acidobacteriota bacterium]
MPAKVNERSKENEAQVSAPVVGIDLGTTNSLIAYMDMGVPRVISDAQGAP